MVTVSIVCYHTEVDELSRSLDSLQSAAVGRIYVVDNSSQAYLRDYCRERGVEYISSANVGYGAGHNQAIRRALAAYKRRADCCRLRSTWCCDAFCPRASFGGAVGVIRLKSTTIGRRSRWRIFRAVFCFSGLPIWRKSGYLTSDFLCIPKISTSVDGCAA